MTPLDDPGIDEEAQLAAYISRHWGVQELVDEDGDEVIAVAVPAGFVPADTAGPELVCVATCATDAEIVDWFWREELER